MKVRAPAIGLALAVVVVWSRAAGAADICPAGNDPTAGPLAGGTGAADFGAVPEACGATGASLRLRGALRDASGMPDYYRSLVGTATLRARYQVGGGTTLTAAADVFAYRYIEDAGLTSHGASAGPATIGVEQTFALGAATASALYARLLVPVDTARQEGIETGLELGGALRLPLGSRVVLDGGVSLAAPLDVVGGQTHLRFEPGALAEAWLRLRPWVALGGGADLRLAVAPSFDLITVAPRLAARFAASRRFWTAALVELPVAGRDHNLVAGLFVGLER